MPRSIRVRTRRIYDPPTGDDGVRILVDRLWPRGLSRARARLDNWLPEAAPSPELRRWFGHDPDRWAEFRRRYLAELALRPVDFAPLVLTASAAPVTLLHAARDERHNHAVVLAELVVAQVAETARRRPRLRAGGDADARAAKGGVGVLSGESTPPARPSPAARAARGTRSRPRSARPG